MPMPTRSTNRFQPAKRVNAWLRGEQLPLWPADVRCAPNEFLRSALFTARKFVVDAAALVTPMVVVNGFPTTFQPYCCSSSVRVMVPAFSEPVNGTPPAVEFFSIS